MTNGRTNKAFLGVGWISLNEKQYKLFCKLQVDRLEEELMKEQEKLKGITEELERTFAELSGY